MVPEITQIQQSLEQLSQDTIELAHSARDRYRQYLAILGPAVAQKLVLASYHLCTQVYPEAFLQLSLNQQQALQQGIQQLGQKLQTLLTDVLQPLDHWQETADCEPEPLMALLQEMEQSILDAFRQISQQANQLLQEHQIINITSMDLLFDIASKAAEQGRSITSAPHLIKALMDDQDESSTDSKTDPIVAIFLQLSDLEFTDTEVMNERHQLRQLWQTLKSLQASYSQKQQEKMIAEATAAWRASWFPAQAEE